MSWFGGSLATTLNLDDNGEPADQNAIASGSTVRNSSDDTQTDELSSGRSIKEDLSEIKKTLTRNFWGVASFLAPPPPSSSDSDPTGSDPDESDSALIPSIRDDFAEIGGRFRSGISKLSNNMAAVSEITTKMASNLLQLGTEDEERDYYDFSASGSAVGVTDGVIAFVRDIVMHPETWLDFPLPEDEDDKDFNISDAQQEHALAVERLAPRLAALRMELCPGYMSETCFWKIYFVLLHPRLDQHDAEVLSTPQIVKARSLLTQNSIRNHTLVNLEQDLSNKGAPSNNEDVKSPNVDFLYAPSNTQLKTVPIETSALEGASQETDVVTEKHPVLSNEIPIVDKSVIKEENVVQNMQFSAPSKVYGETDEDDADEWLKEEASETVGSSERTIPIDNDEDVSFSDLEDEGDVPSTSTKVAYSSDSSTTRDWVQLGRNSAPGKDANCVTSECDMPKQVNRHEPENKDSNDWLDLDEIEVE